MTINKVNKGTVKCNITAEENVYVKKALLKGALYMGTFVKLNY